MSSSLFRGLRTVIYRVSDMPKAVAWYSELLGQAPYFNEHYYAGFAINGYELGIQPKEDETATGTNVVSYWSVKNIHQAFREMLDKGASAMEAPQDVGGGIHVATLRDPWGNALGIIHESQSEDPSTDGAAGVTALGGIFFRSPDPARLKQWYEEHLGIPDSRYGTNFRWKKPNSGYGYTVWAPFDSKTDYFGSADKAFMINYRVKNLDSLIERFRHEGVTIPKEPELYDYGKFAWVEDPDGNRIELWEANDEVYGQMGEDYVDSY